MSEIEILAPVGGSEQLLAAVRCGADAVYLGTQSFNARRNAKNFDSQALYEAVAYCHIRGVKVYVTLNTLVFDFEIPELDKQIKEIARSGADAIIVQDMAVMSRVKAICPHIMLHASTQMAIHNISGAEILKKLGFGRVILARELSLDEIRIITQSIDIETECFIHGSLCMSVSGMCYLSLMLGGRSGNRGLCAQPCRLNSNAYGREYALSLKDLSFIEEIKKLHAAGVSSFKIEGRMKRPEYVAAAVTACKNALEGKAVDCEKLQAVFSRSGFTKGYLTARRGSEMFGIRSKEDVTSAGSVLKEFGRLYDKEKSVIPIRARLQIRKDRSAELIVTAKGKSALVFGDKPQEKNGKTLLREDALRFLSKTGGTAFFLEKADIEIDEGLTMSSAQINSLRRNALSRLEKELTMSNRAVIEAPLPLISVREFPRVPKIRLRVEKISQLPEGITAEYIYVPINELLKSPEKSKALCEKVIAELPVLIYPESEQKVLSCLSRLRQLGIKHAATGNLGAIQLIKKSGLSVHGQFGLNVVNSLSLAFYEDMGLSDLEVSFETQFKRIKRLGGHLKRGYIGYGYLPLMQFRVCPVKPSLGCLKCSGKAEISDSRNVKFTLLCRQKEYMTLLNSVPLYTADKEDCVADFVTLYFTVEDKDRVREVYDMFRKREDFDAERTRGLYFREIL